MAGYRLGSCCVSLRCLACLPSIMLRVLVLHDALQLLLLPLLLLPSDQHLSAYLLECHQDILAQAGTFSPPARPPFAVCGPVGSRPRTARGPGPRSPVHCLASAAVAGLLCASASPRWVSRVTWRHLGLSVLRLAWLCTTVVLGLPSCSSLFTRSRRNPESC